MHVDLSFRAALLGGIVQIAAALPASLAQSAEETTAPDNAAAKPPARIDFDREIRPILFSRCTGCHGSGDAKAGLHLNNRDSAIAELDSGNHAIVPGHPEQSELLVRVASMDDDRMPSKGPPLTSSQVGLLRQWIAEGSNWPVHWAYRPLEAAAPPSTTHTAGWPSTDIDLFVSAKLKQAGLAPSKASDERTLLRRVYFDLIGLPPTPEEVDAFLADASSAKYDEVVDRLLASPHYGERWAQHWIDTVHFAETHGHDQDRPRDHAWRYRDYLIRAFNQDKPFGRFVEEQVAGDVLYPDDPWAIVATGFLAAGPWDESSLRDIREDAIDRQIARYLDRDDIVTTTMATFTSTTVHCARCHDHKFDPISQQEYYGLQAVFAGVDKANRPFDPDPVRGRRRAKLSERLKKLDEQLGLDSRASDPALTDSALSDPALQSEVAAWEQAVKQSGGSWQVLEPAQASSAAGATLSKQPDHSLLASGPRADKDTYTIVATTDVSPITALRLEVLADETLPQRGPGRADNGNLHLSEIVVSASPAGNAEQKKPVILQSAKADFDQAGWAVGRALDNDSETAWGIFPAAGRNHTAVFLFKEPLRLEKGSLLTIELKQLHGSGHLIGRHRLSVTSGPAGQAQDYLLSMDLLPSSVKGILAIEPANRTPAQHGRLVAYVLREKIERELQALPPPELVYCGTSRFERDGSFAPTDKPREVRLLKRGDIHQPGAQAEPGALSCVLSGRSSFVLSNAEDEGARRAAMARWLSDPANVLTWRSIANRVWQFHFGRGIVDTPNDFGQMGSAPTHPELLDWLARFLLERGGSLKSLHRLIVTSSAYRQASDYQSPMAAKDADNRYLWRMNRRRLDAEAIHDAVVQISGKLDPLMGGASVRQFISTPGVHVTPVLDYLNYSPDEPGNYRRSVYRFLFRTLPDPFMESLDCPDASQLAPKRSESVTALQALSMLNDKFIVRQSELIAERATESRPDMQDQVVALYRMIFAREPAEAECAAVTAYARKHGLANACRFLLNSNEFMFVD